MIMNKLEQPLSCKVAGDVLCIEIGLARLNGNEHHPNIPELPITDYKEWGKDIVRELTREEEDGSSPLINLLDSAISEAVDMGSSAIDHRKYEIAERKWRMAGK